MRTARASESPAHGCSTPPLPGIEVRFRHLRTTDRRPGVARRLSGQVPVPLTHREQTAPPQDRPTRASGRRGIRRPSDVGPRRFRGALSACGCARLPAAACFNGLPPFRGGLPESPVPLPLPTHGRHDVPIAGPATVPAAEAARTAASIRREPVTPPPASSRPGRARSGSARWQPTTVQAWLHNPAPKGEDCQLRMPAAEPMRPRKPVAATETRAPRRAEPAAARGAGCGGPPRPGRDPHRARGRRRWRTQHDPCPPRRSGGGRRPSTERSGWRTTLLVTRRVEVRGPARHGPPRVSVIWSGVEGVERGGHRRWRPRPAHPA